MEDLVRENISRFKPYEAGKPIKEVQRELGLKRIIKLASNENPLGPSPLALEAIKKSLSNISRYPDGSCFYLKRKLAERLNIQP
ncbi:MAG TPA: histidinol-phosphate transaminase, partial [Candidatus Omnitrophica bacterium]|nr:histidinol-phosphate transaminase [Candidatus Omnitrophota bacterium]